MCSWARWQRQREIEGEEKWQMTKVLCQISNSRYLFFLRSYSLCLAVSYIISGKSLDLPASFQIKVRGQAQLLNAHPLSCSRTPRQQLRQSFSLIIPQYCSAYTVEKQRQPSDERDSGLQTATFWHSEEGGRKKKKTVSLLKYWRCISYYNFLCRGKREMTTWLAHFICTDFKLK